MNLFIRLRNLFKSSDTKKTIICIIGESGTGKSTLARTIFKKYNIPQVPSYTDRLPRKKHDKDHIFLTTEEMDEVWKKKRIGQTIFGDKRYCSLYEDTLSHKVMTYVLDEEGLRHLMYNFSFNIITVRICSTKKLLNERGISKERQNRDKGKFFLPYDSFDFLIFSSNTTPKDYIPVDLQDTLKELIDGK